MSEGQGQPGDGRPGRSERGGAGETRPSESLPQRISPYPQSRLSAPHQLVKAAEEIERADTMLAAAVGSELDAIARQIRALQAQAAEALQRAQRDALLHRARCRFRKRPGEIYHLYRDGEQSYFSMLSPDDWNGAPPHEHVGSYRLEADMRWTPLEQVERRDLERAGVARLFDP
ncbi:MAG: DUF2452 domain-containing protein [Myxococcales bacterium]